MKPVQSLHSCLLRGRTLFAIASLASLAVFLPVFLVAQTQTNAPPAPPQRPAVQIPAPGMPSSPSVVITMEQAIDFARRNNPTLQAQRTLIYQSREDEVTANLRPNPTLSWDAQYLPIFDPHLSSSDYINEAAQFDAGISYLFERGKKRQNRLLAAKGATAVTEAQVADAERTAVSQTAQQFVTALLAKSTLDFSEHLLDSHQHTVVTSLEKQKNGKMTTADLLKIQLQTLQFQNDLTSARIALVQALNTLRELIGFDSVPRNYDIVGDLAYIPMTLTLSDLQAKALTSRPDWRPRAAALQPLKAKSAWRKPNRSRI